MAGHPSDKDGAEGENPDRTEDGLDAKLDRAVPPVGAEAFLLGVGGTHSGRVYSLHHNTVFIGRSDDVDVCVTDPSVSARHAAHEIPQQPLGSLRTRRSPVGQGARTRLPRLLRHP